MQITKSLPHRSDPHVARRIWHFVGVMTMFVIAYSLSSDSSRHAAVFMMLLWLSIDILRLRFEPLNVRLTKIFRTFMRESERHRPSAATFMLVGVTVASYLYARPVLLLTLLFFSLADPMAAYIGTRFGRDRLIGPKTLQGTLAAFAVCFVATIIYCIAFHVMMERLIIVAIVCGVIGAVSELVPIAGLDDNLTFPILCGGLLSAAFLLFGGI